MEAPNTAQTDFRRLYRNKLRECQELEVALKKAQKDIQLWKDTAKYYMQTDEEKEEEEARPLLLRFVWEKVRRLWRA